MVIVRDRLSRILFLPVILTIAVLFTAIPLCAEFDNYYEIEVDPATYFLGGYSAHFGYAFGNARFSAGVFGADIPELFQGNAGWKQRTDGVGLRFDYFPFCCYTTGFFVGPEADYALSRYELRETGRSETRGQFDVGVQLGYRFMFGETGFFFVPRLGIDYVVTPRVVTVDGKEFYQHPVRVYPAVDLGWRF